MRITIGLNTVLIRMPYFVMHVKYLETTKLNLHSQPLGLKIGKSVFYQLLYKYLNENTPKERK